MKVRDVPAIHISGEGNVFVRDDYQKNVEIPGLEACLYLYDLNIQTTWFNCNNEDPSVDLHFSYDTLSEDNKMIAKELEKSGLIKIDYERNLCYITFNATVDDDVNEISNRLLKIVEHFDYQDVLYGYQKVNDEFIYQNFIKFGIIEEKDRNNANVLRELISDYLGMYYDEENNLVWVNEELCKKHYEYLDSQKEGKI